MKPDLRVLAEDLVVFCDHFRIPLFPWQREAGGDAYRRAGGRFVHRLSGISVPRGDGKTWLAARVGGWRLVTARPPALIVSVALDYEGARICLEAGKATLLSHPALAASVEIRADEIRVPSTGSRWLIRSRDHLSSRGLHPDFCIYDECGWAKDDELFASLLAGQASCSDPHLTVVSTVGRRKSGPLWRIKALVEDAAEDAAELKVPA